MTKLTAYQLQATGRARRALKSVAVADGKLRAATRVLSLALAAADAATAAVDAVNTTYGTAFKNSTDFLRTVAANGLDVAGRKTDGASIPTEYPPLVGDMKDGNNGEALPGRAVFGEYEAPAKREALPETDSVADETDTEEVPVRKSGKRAKVEPEV